MTEQAKKYCADLLNAGVTYRAEFVPQSQSRNANEKEPSINWRVTIANGRAVLVIDYTEGCGHLPNFNRAFAHNMAYDAAVRDACETGKSTLIPHKNAYDAAQAARTFPKKTKLPAPAFDEVLYCLVSDADVLNYSGFEDWAESVGYDTDSRSAEKIYRACLDSALKLRGILDIDAAAKAFEDY